MPKATTARTTRSDRMPYRNSRSRRLDTGTSGLLLVIPSRSSLGRGEHAPERPDELGEFERQDEFRGGAVPERLEGVQILEHERFLVHTLRGSEDRRAALRVAFGVQDRGLSPAFRTEDRGLLVALCHGDRCGLPPVGFDDDGTPAPLGGHLENHRVRDVLRRQDLPDLDVRHFDAPTGCDVVELRAQDRVDLLPLRQHLIEDDVADDRSKRCRRDSHRGSLEVVHPNHGVRGARDLEVHDEVDMQRGVVFRDARLVRDREESFPQVHADRLVNPRNHDDDPGPFLRLGFPESEVHDPLVLLDDLEAGEKKDEDDDHEDERTDGGADEIGALERGHRTEVEQAHKPPHTTSPGAGCPLPDLRPLSDSRGPASARIETFILFAQVRWFVSPEDRLQTVLHGSEEVVTRDELRTLLDRTASPRAYVGLEPSGLMHIGTAFVIGSKFGDLIRAGFHAIIFLADWHAYINDKLGRNLESLRICAEYFKDGFRAVGVPDSAEYLYANEFVRHPEYWQNVIQASKASTVARIRRALTIMGRKEEEADLDASKLIYPAMQVADIHWMDLDLALGGMDQRHAHMLYRDVAPKLGWKQVVALHTPLLPALDGGGRMDLLAGKMSKSRPDASILLNDSPEDIGRKIGKAFCPAKETKGNPVLDVARLILFPRQGKLMIPRDAKFGGDVVYNSFDRLANAYSVGELHPKDLKAAVTAGLNRELAPVHKYFDAHPETLSALRNILHAR